MALQLEFERTPNPTPLTESAIKKLIAEGRPPFLMVRDEKLPLKTPICFIPAGESEEARTLRLNSEEVRAIALVRDELQHQH